MRILFVALLILFFISCKKEEAKSNPILAYIPQNAALLIKINDFDLFKSDLKNNTLLKEYQKTPEYSKFAVQFNILNYIKPKGESILSLVEVGKGHFDFFYKTKTDTNLIAFKKTKNSLVERVDYEGHSLNKISLDQQAIYSYSLDSDTFISSSQLLIENLIRTKEIPKINETLEKLYAASGNTNSAVFFINAKYVNSLLNSFWNKKNILKVDAFSDWVSLDVFIQQNENKLTGVSIADGSDKFLNLFKNIKPITNTTQNYAPINAEAILSYTFDDFDTYYGHQQKYLESLPKKDTIFKTTQEIGIAYLNDKKNIFIHTYDSEILLKYISSYTNNSSSYQGNEIFKLTEEKLLKPFEALLPNFSTNYATVLENVVVFSEDLETLQNTVTSFKNEATFEKSATYLNAKNSISDESNILLIATPDYIQKNFKDDSEKDNLSNPSSFNFSNQLVIAQIVADKNFFHTSLLLKKLVPQTQTNITAPLYTVRLDSDITTEPQFVINHRTNKKEIIVQDQENTLYLISTNGNVLWKKHLKGKIKGKIHQVDLYKNGRLQYAFITDNQFLILDRNGEIVPPFDKKFDTADPNFLSVFDYENNRDYRFLITLDSKIIIYSNEGDIVKGFNFTKSNSRITNAPKHFRIHSKDYIAFTEENGDLRILNRIGSDRIRVKEKVNFSQNEIFLYKDKFSFTDTKGILYQIDENGTISKNNLNLDKDHGFYATSNSLATMDDHTLTIKGKKTELELGVYSKPHIFYIYDKIYVSVTDIQNQKIYLFDSASQPIQNFPVYGTSMIDLADIDNDQKLELLAKDLENSLIVYRIN